MPTLPLGLPGYRRRPNGPRLFSISASAVPDGDLLHLAAHVSLSLRTVGGSFAHGLHSWSDSPGHECCLI
ncbi:hypothetical protein ACFVFQ_31575 [Streptomyces sp. NPDC057743]|uniref:hypothetical protein n=1 Tax=Streptomyces sp. NPDC057743 TaxID=3346236 RepID=UPI0036C5E0EE